LNVLIVSVLYSCITCNDLSFHYVDELFVSCMCSKPVGCALRRGVNVTIQIFSRVPILVIVENRTALWEFVFVQYSWWQYTRCQTADC